MALAVAGAGFAALVALPFLLLSSAVSGAPLAVPAVIGLGYLAASHALLAQQRRRAGLINATVLCALVGWPLLLLLMAERPPSHAVMVAALMTPLFAAAPALVRSLMSAWRVRPDATAALAPMARDTALERVAGLDELAPSERVIVLNAEGSVLAATAAARKALRMLPDAFEHHLSSLFETHELARLTAALDGCIADVEPVGVEGVRPLQRCSTAISVRNRVAGDELQTLAATLSPCGDGLVALRLHERPLAGCASASVLSAAFPGASVAQTAKPGSGPSCDIGEAIAFALRHARPKATARRIELTFAPHPSGAAACDRQVGRQIMRRLIDSALNGSQAGSSIQVVARRLRGVVLFRVTSRGTAATSEGMECDDLLDITDLRALVESAGGTLVVDRQGHDIALSVRLALMADVVGQKPVDENV